MTIRALVFLAACAALPAAAASADPPRGRFSDAFSYTGEPRLSLTLALIEAGGGAKDYKTTTLFGVLAGERASAELNKLTKQYGADVKTSFLDVFDFVIADALRLAAENHVTFPKSAAPSPKDGKALSAALYKTGIDKDRRFDVEYMLDGLVGHPIHAIVMDDIDKKFGRKADALYHVILTQAIMDLKALYRL